MNPAHLARAREIITAQGREALNTPHARIGRSCKCGDCFCCAALAVVRQHDEQARIARLVRNA